MLLVVPSLFLFSCSRPVIVDTIDVDEARNFINTKYEHVEYQQPSFEKTLVNWKITKDNDAQDAAKHIGSYLSNPKEPTPVTEDKGNKVHIEDEARINAFKTELEEIEEPKYLGTIGHEAVLYLNPTIYEALYHGQGEPETKYSLIYKYNGTGAGRGLKITSDYQDTNYTHRRIHTYNKDGHETKFELIVSNDILNYSLTINFKY